MSDRWHVLRDDGSYTLTRRLPVRFDVSATIHLPMARKDRLARQIRQDMWRALQSVRGFSPVVQVVEVGNGLDVTAGGAIAGRAFPRARIEAQLVEMLDDPARRARWIRWAS